MTKDKELQRLLRIVLQKYPELKNYIFSIGYSSLTDAFAECEIDGKKVEILVDSELKNKNKDLKVASIASELSHVIKEKKLSVIPLGFANYIEGLIYEKSRAYRNYDERQTDIETIKRGFGEELLELLKYDEQGIDDQETEMNDQEKSEGLNIGELQKILRDKRKINA